MEEGQQVFQVSSVETALCNHLILTNIFKDLSVKNLKAFRLVNSAWCEAATHVLKKIRALKLRLHYLTDIQTLEATTTSKTVPSLSYEWDFGYITLPNCDPWVVSRQVDLLNATAHKTQEETRGVSVYVAIGGQRSLGGISGLNAEDEQRVLHILDTILFGVRNLVVLHLDLVNYENVLEETRINQDAGAELQYLEEVHLHLRRLYGRSGYASICRYIFGMSPNLKLITGARLSILDVIMECDKAKCLKSLEIDGCICIASKTDSIRDALNAYLQQAPMLTSLQVLDIPWMPSAIMSSIYRDDIWNSVYRLFMVCRRTITSLRASNLVFLDRWSETEGQAGEAFEQLQYMELSDTSERNRLLPFDINLSVPRLFPSLRHVKLHLAGCTNTCLQKYFPTIILGNSSETFFSTIPTVEKLELDAPRYDQDGLTVLCKIFPNVKEVKIRQDITSYVYSLQNDIWDLPSTVECVTLHLLATDGRKKLRNLDELLTGISRNVLKKLPRDRVSSVHLETAFRRGIRKLPALKCLKIIFDVHKNYALTQFGAKRMRGKIMEDEELEFFVGEGTFTELSGMYVFQPSAFKTFIYYDGRAHCARDMQEMLMPLAPYAVIDATYTSQLSKSWNRSRVMKVARPQINDPDMPSCSKNQVKTRAESIPWEFPDDGTLWKWPEEDSTDTETY